MLIATATQQEIDDQTRDQAFLLRDTLRKINESTATMEKRVIEEVDKIRVRNEEMVKRRIEPLIQDNKEIIDLLERLSNGSE